MRDSAGVTGWKRRTATFRENPWLKGIATAIAPIGAMAVWFWESRRTWSRRELELDVN
jgi:hypothetical protein